MCRTARKQRTGPRRGFVLALLCILLVIIAGTIQVAHSHPHSLDNHADCSLCATAHVAVHLVHIPAPVPTITAITIVEELPHSYTPTALSIFALFTRPPPASALPA